MRVDLIAEATRLAPALASRADDFEKARRIPADVSLELARAGMYRMFIPRIYGGLEASPIEGVRAFEILARADASAAWVAFIGATSGTVLTRLLPDIVRKVFATPETMLAGVFAPTGKAERVGRTFRANGRWQWGSGTQNAQWIAGGCAITEGGEPVKSRSGAPQSHMLLFRSDQVEFLDTWHVSGLKGSGSLDYQVKDVVVPEGYASGYLVRESPPAPLYQFPQFTFLALGIAAVTLGIARGAIDDLVGIASTKVRGGGGAPIANRPYTQMEVAAAEARLRSSRAFYYEVLEAAWACAVAGDPVSIDMRRDLRLATTHAVLAATSVVDAMYPLGGGSSVYESSCLQRRFRDIHVATQHIMVAPSTLETVGRLLLGVETNAAQF